MSEEEIKNEFINCIEGSHTLNLAISILEDRQELQQENSQLKEKIEYLKSKIENKDKWCQLIADIGYDYDGFRNVESLMALIDELVKYALNSRDNYDYEELLKGDKE